MLQKMGNVSERLCRLNFSMDSVAYNTLRSVFLLTEEELGTVFELKTFAQKAVTVNIKYS